MLINQSIRLMGTLQRRGDHREQRLDFGSEMVEVVDHMPGLVLIGVEGDEHDWELALVVPELE